MNTTPSIFDLFAQTMREVYAPALKDGNDVAEFAHMQSGMGIVPEFPQFNLIVSVGAYPIGATVGVETLARLGYSAPAIPSDDIYASRSVDDCGELLAN
jgi:hypothetical protein